MSAQPIHYEPTDDPDLDELPVGRRMFQLLINQGAPIEMGGGGAVAIAHGVAHIFDPCPSVADRRGVRLLCDEKRGHDGVHGNDERGFIWSVA